MLSGRNAVNPKGFKWGTWNAVCDVCGIRYKSDELQDRWDGAKVCSWDWEPQHPMDFQKIPRTEKPIPWARPVNETFDESIVYADTNEDIPAGTFNISDPLGS